MTPSLRAARAVYAAALHLWPRSLRERRGEEMRATFDELSAEAAGRGPRALIALLAAEMADLTTTTRTAQKVAQDFLGAEASAKRLALRPVTIAALKPVEGGCATDCQGPNA